MLKNYFSIISRQIWKNKVFAFINVLGLALGMTICLVISQYVGFHKSFDSFNTKAENIFRLESKITTGNNEELETMRHPAPLSEKIAELSPRIKDNARIFNLNYLNSTIEYKGKDDIISFEQEGIYAMEGSFYDIFTVDFISGGNEKFGEPFKAILTESAAIKYFSNLQTAIGQTFTLKGNTGNQDYELVGVIKDLPLNSHIQFQVALSYLSINKYGDYYLANWETPNFVNYFLLNDPADKAQVEALANKVYKERPQAGLSKEKSSSNFYLENIQDIHLKGKTFSDFVPTVDSKIILILSVVALVILFIAWINYLNLSLVKTMERLKEMGVRKYLGSTKSQLVALFIFESLIMNIMALLITVLLVNVSSDYLIQTTGLPITSLFNTQVFILLGVIIGLGTAFTGLYPIFLLKAVNLASVLVGKRGNMVNSKSRRGLVLIQFVVTFLLIAGTLTIYQQINYMRDSDLGIDIENILVLQAPPTDMNSNAREGVNKFNTMTTTLLKYPGIKDVSMAAEIPGKSISWGSSLYLKNQLKEDAISAGLIAMSPNYPEFMGIDVVAGRALRQGDDPWSKGDVVINERLAEMLGFANPEDAIGADIAGFMAPLQVRGVLENHHQTSLHNDYQPIAYIISGWTRYYYYKLRIDENSDESRSEQLNALVATVESEWDKVFPTYPMEYTFADQAFDQQYKEDYRFGKIFSGFSVLAIVIACLGLFGLTSLTVNQRVKEIGIRKILGAGVMNLIGLLTREYLLLVGFASLIGMPAAWYIMDQWLAGYSFRIAIGWWFFIAPVLIITILALASVMGKIYKVVRSNPAEALRYE